MVIDPSIPISTDMINGGEGKQESLSRSKESVFCAVREIDL
jgi:hypothetical protein